MNQFKEIDISECLHIGDNYNDDVIGAKTSGYKSIWITDTPK